MLNFKTRPRLKGSGHLPARSASLVVLVALGLAACVGVTSTQLPGPGDQVPFARCAIDKSFLVASLGRDAIPSLDDPVWVRANATLPAYLDADTRVVGVMAAGQAWAIPHNVLWHHEIVNLDAGGANGEKFAITYCPLTGSSVVFNRSSVGGVTLGVSGLLFMNNLVVFDRREPEESLWPQMLAQASCGPRIGEHLEQLPYVEMAWAEWLSLHPSTNVLAQNQGFDPELFDYTRFGYPYGAYRSVDAPFSGATPPPR